jgi:hypothetical protein
MIPRALRRFAPLAAALLLACGNKKPDVDRAPAPPSASASAPAPIAPEGPASAFSVVLEAQAPVAFSAVEGGVLVADAARSHLARAAGEDDLADGPMPSGLPTGAGRVLRAAGRMPNSLWLLFEKQRDDGKPESNPLFRLSREGWKQLADDWKPAVAAWTKRRILAASTSSGRLKIKVIEPSLPEPPADLPSVHLTDASCEKTLALADLAALPTGEVLAAGTCKPDLGAGAGASAKRYVIIRWPAPAGKDAGAPPTGDAGDGAIDAGSSDAGAAEGGPPGVVDVMPGVSAELTHRALHARTASEIYAAASDATGKGTTSQLFRFDGGTWGVEPLPAGFGLVRGVAATADGVLWLAAEHAIFRRAAAGAAWEPAPLPGAGAWEILDLRVTGDRDVWIAARRTGADGARDLVLRSRPPKAPIRW